MTYPTPAPNAIDSSRRSAAKRVPHLTGHRRQELRDEEADCDEVGEIDSAALRWRWVMISLNSVKLGFRLTLIITLVALITLALTFVDSNSGVLGAPQVLRARATIEGAPGSGILGEAVFTEIVSRYSPVSEVRIVVRVAGLAPGLHGFHIHEIGLCVPPTFTSTGGHFDPGPFGSSTPVDANHPYHAGDLPNLEVNEAGIGHLEYVTSRITLRANAGNGLSVFDANGSAVIVHQNEDLGLNGVTGASGGPRIGCGVIEAD
jgi:Cu-Zn family superoxide dismutase